MIDVLLRLNNVIKLQIRNGHIHFHCGDSMVIERQGMVLPRENKINSLNFNDICMLLNVQPLFFNITSAMKHSHLINVT